MLTLIDFQRPLLGLFDCVIIKLPVMLGQIYWKRVGGTITIFSLFFSNCLASKVDIHSVLEIEILFR